MLPGTNPPDIRERKLRDWIFSLLRFAVTHSPDDQAAALTLAIELDRSGGPSELTFFQRTSLAVRRAMVLRDEDGNQILQQYLSRIEDPRLKNVFAPAIGRDDISLGHPRKKARRGLPRRPSLARAALDRSPGGQPIWAARAFARDEFRAPMVRRR